MRYLITPLLAAGVTVLSTAPAHADLDDQLAKLLPDLLVLLANWGPCP